MWGRSWQYEWKINSNLKYSIKQTSGETWKRITLKKAVVLV